MACFEFLEVCYINENPVCVIYPWFFLRWYTQGGWSLQALQYTNTRQDGRSINSDMLIVKDTRSATTYFV